MKDFTKAIGDKVDIDGRIKYDEMIYLVKTTGTIKEIQKTKCLVLVDNMAGKLNVECLVSKRYIY